MKRILSAALALSLCLTLCAAVFADDPDADSVSAVTPVYLSSTQDGSIGGEPAAAAMSVTVPTAFPVAVSPTGDVASADSCRIINHSYGAVRVKSVTITAAGGWRLTAFGGKDTLSHEKVDSNRFGFAIRLGSGPLAVTDSSSDTSQVLISGPADGLRMSGAGDSSSNSLNISYSAIVTPLSRAVSDANIANVVFILEWDTVD